MTNISNKKLIVISGPTASGKTSISIQLAKQFGSEIVSSDSRQIYKEMSIGTAKPSEEELSAVPHHMIGVRSVREDYSAGQYETDALEIIDKLFSKHDILFLVGGSGMYIDAVCNGMDALPEVDKALREKLTKRVEQDGLAPLLEELKRLDPAHYDAIDKNNPQRVIRALEVSLQSGKPYSEMRTGIRKQRNFDTVKIGINMPRDILYDRINRRVDVMMESGLEKEARELYNLRNYNALQTVGYKELFEYFDGKTTRDEAIELIKRNSRRYAKRQLTWFNRDTDIRWFDLTIQDTDEIFNHIHDLIVS